MNFCRITAALLVASWLAGCSGARSFPLTGSAGARRYEFSHPQMGTVFKIVFFADGDSLAQRAARAVFDRVDTLNAIMSDYLPESELMRLCDRAGTGSPVAVSPDLWKILTLSARFSRQSGGAFDVTVGPLTRLWRRARSLQELPDSARIEAARQLVDYHNLQFYPKKRGVALARAGMKLDLGGIAQGYAADACLEVLKQYGITRALADAGGDIALGDPPPGEKGWKIETPAAQNPVPSVQLLARCGITTSGATYRYLQVDGRRYSHIVDPRTGWGLTHRVLVTVRAPDATTADAWATAISVSGAEGWGKIRRRHPGIQVWINTLDL